MESKKENFGILLNMSKEESLVLFDWLVRFNEKDNTFEDQAEERVLFDLEATLEKSISDVLSSDYSTILKQSREKVRD